MTQARCASCRAFCDGDLLRILIDCYGNGKTFCSTDCLFKELLETRCKEEVEKHIRATCEAMIAKVS